jgi:hypothetical protein
MKFTSTRIRSRCAAGLCVLVFIAAISYAQTPPTITSATGSSGLIGQLTKGLAVTPTQAKGGAGALFSLAKSRLSPAEFTQVASAVPGMKGLLSAAPVASKPSELSSLEGELPGHLGTLATVAEAFHKLGLSPEMAAKFVPVMTKFVESRGGSTTASLLEKALK